MEEGEATAVICQASPKIAPSLNFMHRFISDQFFENGGRGSPFDSLKLQESAIESGAQQVPEVGVERFKMGSFRYPV